MQFFFGIIPSYWSNRIRRGKSHWDIIIIGTIDLNSFSSMQSLQMFAEVKESWLKPDSAEAYQKNCLCYECAGTRTQTARPGVLDGL